MARQPVAAHAAASVGRSRVQLRAGGAIGQQRVGLQGTLRQGVLSLRAQENIFVGDIVEYPLPEVTMYVCMVWHTNHTLLLDKRQQDHIYYIYILIMIVDRL
jgi:hypothetical protein